MLEQPDDKGRDEHHPLRGGKAEGGNASGLKSLTKGMKLIGATLATLLVLGSGIAITAQADSSESGQGAEAALSEPPSEEPGVEIQADRTATSQTFQLPDGSRETRIFENAVNYRDPEGKWKPIEEGLGPAEGAALTNGTNRFDVRLPARLGAGPMRLSVGEEWVSSQLLGPTSEAAQLEGDSASYEAADPGTSFEFSSLANGLKEDIEISGPSQPSTFRFELAASAGVAPKLMPDGSIEFRDEEDHLVATLPAPVMSDASTGPDGISPAVEYKLEAGSSGSWLLTVEASREWLNQPDRQWPVRIDPTVVVPNASNDCILNSSLEDQTLCAASGWPQLLGSALYHASGADQIRRSTLQFDLSAIPTTADVTEATVGLYSPSKALNSSGVQLRRLTSAWNDTTRWRCATDALPLGCVKWTTPGGDFTEEGSEVLTSERGSEPGWWTFKGLTPLVQGWLSGSKLRAGLLVKLKDEAQHECCIERMIEFASSAASNPSQRPYLSVTYIPQAPTTSKVTSPTEGTVTARRLKLKSAWTVAGVTGVTYQFREAKTGTFQTIPSELVSNGSGKTVSWPLATEGAKEAEPLYFDAAHATSTLRKKGLS